MPNIRCPNCKQNILNLPGDFRDTVQCDSCAVVLRAVIKKGVVVDARLRTIDLDIPDKLPDELEQVLAEAVSCFEIGSYAGCIVLAGLFVEGMLKKAGIKGDRLVDMISAAHEAGIFSELGFHVATASRYFRNMGAHYSDDLVSLTSSDARLVLEMVRKLAADVLVSGKLVAN